MAVQSDKLDFSQPDNEMSRIADMQRQKLFPKNDFSPESDSYSATHPDALADGDKLGRGTGVPLDIYDQKIGTATDLNARKEELKVNKYSQNNPYYTVN
jgi:hypothetical protein